MLDHVCLFTPPSVEKVGQKAFDRCAFTRILSFPLNTTPQQIGDGAFDYCDTFFKINHQITKYGKFMRGGGNKVGIPCTNGEVKQSIIDLCHNHPTLHRSSLSTDVSAQTINDCILVHGRHAAYTIDHDGMTPLHLLAINPYVDLGAIMTCFDTNMSAVFELDSRGDSPLDYLKEYDNVEDLISLVEALCVHLEANYLKYSDPLTSFRVPISMESSARKKRKVGDYQSVEN